MTDLRRLAEDAMAEDFLDPGSTTLTGAAFGAWEAELADFQDQCYPEVILALLDPDSMVIVTRDSLAAAIANHHCDEGCADDIIATLREGQR